MGQGNLHCILEVIWRVQTAANAQSPKVATGKWCGKAMHSAECLLVFLYDIAVWR